MTRTDKKVGYLPKSKHSLKPIRFTQGGTCAPEAAEEMFRILEGRWKMAILYHLFGGKDRKCPVMRFSELERAIPAISQKTEDD
jgi:DNA-binding HxlR family transcriptional regulator